MLPNKLAAGREKSPTQGNISVTFKPASVTRKAIDPVSQKKELEKPQFASGGLGYVAATEVKVTSVQQEQLDVMKVDVADVGGNFFQVSYRDEYHPSRPNSYEVYCKERTEKKKLEEVKRELNRRQKEQEREGKLEREQLTKDLAEGRALAMKLPAPAGRGRGMTMPAWMRKKIEESAAASQPESERDVDQERGAKMAGVTAMASQGQFEDAVELEGVSGFSNSLGGSSLSASASEFSTSKIVGPTSRSGADKTSGDGKQSDAVALDEFGREIRQEPKQAYKENRDDRHHKTTGRESSGRYSSRVNESHRSSGIHGSGEKRRRTSGWDSKSPSKTLLSSCVVLLQNMVGPGEVDDELQDEVKSECGEKYGLVVKCVLYEETGRIPSEEAVRIFVKFKNAGDATRGTVMAPRLCISK